MIRRADGRREPWTLSGGVWQGDPDSKFLLTQDASGFTVTRPDGTQERYGTGGKILDETTPQGHTTTYGYDSLGQLSSVTGPFGHALTISYESWRINKITLPSGDEIRYMYDSNVNLVNVHYPDGSERNYHYEHSEYPNLLTGISDENGNRYATFSYYSDGKASLTQHAATTNVVPQERFSLVYDSDTQTTVTDPDDEDWTYIFEEKLGVKNLLSKTSNSDGIGISQAFDANNNLTSRTDEEGKTTEYTYYPGTNQRETITEAFGTPEARTTTYEYYSPDIDLVTKVKRPSVGGGWRRKQVITAYNATSLNPTSVTIRGFRPDTTATERKTSLTYNADNQLWRINGPRTDVNDFTTFPRYPNCTTGYECGQIKIIRNALNHETKIDEYDANGRVKKTTDPLGVVTDYEYDPRGRIEQITQTPPAGQGDPRTTVYTYYGIYDQIKTVTTPDNVVLTYTYDEAHDLRSIADNLGNKVEYQYDVKGNRNLENTLDPGGTLVRTMDTVYDLRNRVESINAAGAITQSLRDGVGNIMDEIDPKLNPPTEHEYDNLHRLEETIDALGKSTHYDYDVLDHLTQLIAPNGATTNYVYDDLDNLLQETSPDRGTLVYTHDNAGNVLTVTDDRGVVVTYTYDALNRVTSVDYSGTTEEDITFIYDTYGTTCTNGIGRLCAVTDHSGTTEYEYDVWGNVTKETKTENLTPPEVFVTEYTYDAADRVDTMTYPNGRIVTYHRDAIGRIERVSSTVNGTTTDIVSNRTYRADGLLEGQAYENGLQEDRKNDQRGQLYEQTLTGLHRGGPVYLNNKYQSVSG